MLENRDLDWFTCKFPVAASLPRARFDESRSNFHACHMQLLACSQAIGLRADVLSARFHWFVPAVFSDYFRIISER